MISDVMNMIKVGYRLNIFMIYNQRKIHQKYMDTKHGCSFILKKLTNKIKTKLILKRYSYLIVIRYITVEYVNLKKLFYFFQVFYGLHNTN